ncbi:hypothetical protein [Timonella senegalensis]|uniref:hypothetical protein n=1 Tax=Timonella senegalensis TaxID=1465825 RepID=UPI0028B25EDA|nr:hypothetical protein [Timonella senegalensis]
MADLTTAVEVVARADTEFKDALRDSGSHAPIIWDELPDFNKAFIRERLLHIVVALDEAGMLKDAPGAGLEHAVEVAARGRYMQVALERGYEPWESLDPLSQEPWLTNARLYITALHAAGLLKASDE